MKGIARSCDDGVPEHLRLRRRELEQLVVAVDAEPARERRGVGFGRPRLRRRPGVVAHGVRNWWRARSAICTAEISRKSAKARRRVDFGQAQRDLGADQHAGQRAEADQAGRSPLDQTRAVLAERADGDDGHDGSQRRGLAAQLREAEAERQRGHEDDAPADPEQAGEHPAREAERDGQRDVAHQASLAATTTITHANASCRCGPRTRLASVVPNSTPTTAGTPISRASCHTTRPSKE